MGVGVSSNPGVSVISGKGVSVGVTSTVGSESVPVGVGVPIGVIPGTIVKVTVGDRVIVAVSSGVDVGGEHFNAK